MGGDMLFIESAPAGQRRSNITGNLGKIMKESATIALEYIKANAARFGLDQFLLTSLIFISTFRKGQL